VTLGTAATPRAWLDRAVSLLADAGVPSPHNDAVLLAVDGVGIARADLSAVADPPDAYWTLVRRRARREPLQHLLGRAWFRHIEVAVGPGVFVPRPETEVVAGAAIEEAARIASAGRTPVVVDLGTGSGVIALSVAHEVPAATVHAVEVDESALRWARRNCAGSRVVVHHADFADAVADQPDLVGRVDVVVSNPPYIPPDGVPVDPEVRDHDPARALYGSGLDGLGEVRAVVATARRLLAQGGLVVVEHADCQGPAVAALIGDGWVDVVGHRDLTGRERFVTARRAPGAS
jgi:release factor glutamine methyltransferase